MYQLLSIHGQNKDAPAKNKVGEWEHDIIGLWYKCNMTDVIAAIGLRQLDRYLLVLKRRKEIISYYFFGISIMIPFESSEIHYQYMSGVASLNNREDGTNSLIILSGKSGYVWDTNVYVEYQHNGDIRIRGTSDKISWCPLSKVFFEPDIYTFSGLSGVKKNAVGIVLETKTLEVSKM